MNNFDLGNNSGELRFTKIIHSNVLITNMKSIEKIYYNNFIDDHIKKMWVYLMRHKYEKKKTWASNVLRFNGRGGGFILKWIQWVSERTKHSKEIFMQLSPTTEWITNTSIFHTVMICKVDNFLETYII